MAGENKGRITQVIGAVLDVRFDEGKLPEINDAIRIPTRDGGELVVEVSSIWVMTLSDVLPWVLPTDL